MPDKDGWHVGLPVMVAGRPHRWHYCEGSDRDELVADTREERRAHERDCRKRTRAARDAADRARRRAATQRLRNVNRLRRENRAAS